MVELDNIFPLPIFWIKEFDSGNYHSRLVLETKLFEENTNIFTGHFTIKIFIYWNLNLSVIFTRKFKSNIKHIFSKLVRDISVMNFCNKILHSHQSKSL